MKTKIKSHLLIAIFALSTLSLSFLSCSKQDVVNPGGSAPLTKEQIAQKNLRKILKKLPKSYVYDGKVVTLTKDGFSFSSPHDGFNYSSNTGVNYSEESQTVYISGSSLGANSGGTVVAGNSALDINYTFCMAASDEGLGVNFFGPEFTGVSLVLGISGDFEAMANMAQNQEGEEEPNFLEYFYGIAEYVVYADQANGSYQILNWLEDLNTDEEDLADKGFAIVIDFQNNKLYLSLEGTLTVNGGSISFNGRYLSLGAFDAFDENEEGEISYEIVDGFGTMGCN